MKPVIAVSAQTANSYTEYYGNQTVSGVYDLYVRALTDAGALPVVLAHSDPSDVPHLLERFDGVLLPGGGDMDPSSYGEVPEADSLYGIRPTADLFEVAVVREAQKRRLPLFGVCRGLQVINVAFGGTLHQDLPDHPKDLVDRAFAGHYRAAIDPTSRLHSIVNNTELVINSLHHQGVKDVGEGLKIGAAADDGVVESIESTDLSWEMLAVQWHPECLRKDHSVALLDWFVDAAKRRMTKVDVHLVPERPEVVRVGRSAAAAS